MAQIQIVQYYTAWTVGSLPHVLSACAAAARVSLLAVSDCSAEQREYAGRKGGRGQGRRGHSPVGEQGAGTAKAEEAVADEHGAVVAHVPVLGDVLVVHDQGQLVGHRLSNKSRNPNVTPTSVCQSQSLPSHVPGNMLCNSLPHKVLLATWSRRQLQTQRANRFRA